MILTILVSMIQVPAYAAVDNMILNNAYNRQIIGTIIIAMGMQFEYQQQVEDGITEFIDQWNDHETGWQMPNNGGGGMWQDIIDGITVGSKIAYDLNSGKLKQIITLPADLLDYFKDWVDMKYQQLENFLTNPSFWIIDTITVGNYYFPSNSDYYFYGKNSDGTLSNGRINPYNHYVLNEITNYYYDGNNVNNVINPIVLGIVKSTSIQNVFRLSTETGSVQLGYTYTDGRNQQLVVSTQILDMANPQYPVPTNGKSTGYGNPIAVDNPDYNFTNNQTGLPTIVMPLEVGTDNLPATDTDGYFIPATDTEDLIGTGISDLQNEDTSGLDVPMPTPTPTTEPQIYPDMTQTDTATETEFDNPNKRALYQTKFPFSLPWDLKAIFMLLQAPAKAPKWEIDVVTPELKSKIGITRETKFVFDMGEFELVGKVTRFFTFIGFCLTLIFVTRNIIRS